MTKYNDSVARGDEKAERQDCGSPRPVMRLGDGGFTLAELMVVVGIIGIMVTIAIPNYIKMLPHLRLKSAARDVASAMQLARMTSISKNVKTQVSVNRTTNTFDIKINSVVTSAAVHSGDWKDIDIYAPTGGMVANNPPLTDDTVEFKPDGTTSITSAVNKEGEAVYMKNTSTSAEKYRVRVVRTTGMIYVEKWDGSAWVRS